MVQNLRVGGGNYGKKRVMVVKGVSDTIIAFMLLWWLEGRKSMIHVKTFPSKYYH